MKERAVDAYKVQGLLDETDWSLEHILYLTEEYNGFGYMKMGKASPYVWGLTNIAGLGKYIKDGKYSATAVETQPGTAALLRRLMDLDPSIKIGPKKTAQEVVEQPLTKSGVAITSATGAVAGGTAAISQVTDSINSVNSLKEAGHKLGLLDGAAMFISHHPFSPLFVWLWLLGVR